MKVIRIKVIDIFNKIVIFYGFNDLHKFYELRFGEKYCGKIKKNDYLKFILDSLFGKYTLYDHQQTGKREKGHPDFLIRTTNDKGERESIYIELKYPKDSLRISQLEWIIKNPDKKTLIIEMLED